MSEEDTFRKLKKISFEDLDKIIHELTEDEFFKLVDNEVLKEEFLNSYGWGSIEFDKVVREHY